MPSRSPTSRPQLPTKWLLAFIGVLLAYGLAQPTLNARLGWNLPSVAGLLGDGDETKAKPLGTQTQVDSEVGQWIEQPAEDSNHQLPEKTVTGKTASQSDTTVPESGPEVDQASAVETVEDFLQESAPGSEDFLSPGGLRYTRGSEEGHRLKHLSKHLEDQPTRPGKHGVFSGDLLQVLRWLDAGYERAQRGAKGTSKKTEDRRTVYEVTFDHAIGYVGGRDGKRAGNPTAKRIRMVVEGNRVITAFPF